MEIEGNHWAKEVIITKLTINLFGFSRGGSRRTPFCSCDKTD